MNVLVINSGSSSLKYQLFDMDQKKVLAKGLCERIGIDGAVKHTTHDGKEYKDELTLNTHDDAIKVVLDLLTGREYGVIDSVKNIDAIGQRVAHGGKFKESVLVDQEALDYLYTTQKLAPLHNPPVVKGIEACKKIMGNVPQVTVFDTSFHTTMEEHVYLFPLPYELYEKYDIKRYGFHGTSHRYVSLKAAEYLGKDIKDLKIVSCHLGNGSSITAIKDGKSFDTSMGFTPLDGIMMGTRCGSIDPAVVTYLIKDEGMSAAQVDSLLNKKSGFLGGWGITSDWRDVCAAADKGEHRAVVAKKMVAHQLRKYIGAYAAAMGGIDVLIFTAGIGENSSTMREIGTQGLEFLGIEIDHELNKTMARGQIVNLSAKDAKVTTLVIPTDEEYMIALDTERIVKEAKNK